MKNAFEILVLIFALAAEAVHGAPRWEISSTADGWKFLRDGQPFYIEGAVAPNRFDVLQACGGNAVRVNASQKALDAAQAVGLAVMANLPVRGERNQLDWDKAEQVAEQKEKVLALVRELKDHPALMFYWAEKQETTHTWYGLFCNGLRTESIDVMQRLWTGQWPVNRAPAIQGLGIEGFAEPRSTDLQAAKMYRAAVKAADPDSDALTYAWDIRPEVVIPPGSYAGGLEKRAEPIPGFISNSAVAAIEFTAPGKPGAYRLFVTVTDGQGHLAYGNIPFFVSEGSK